MGKLRHYHTWVPGVKKTNTVKLDMFDSNGDFMIQVPDMARRCPALLYAMLALSARQVAYHAFIKASNRPPHHCEHTGACPSPP